MLIRQTRPGRYTFRVPNAPNLNRSGFLRSGYCLCRCLVSGVVSGWLAGWSCGGARVRTGSDRAGVVLLSCSWDGSCWSSGSWQGAQPLPAVEEGLLSGPVPADGQGPLPGVMLRGGRGGARRGSGAYRVGVPRVRVVAVAEETGPGREVGGDVRGDDAAAVGLPGPRRQGAKPHGLGGADAAGLDDGVLAVDDVDVLRVVAARHAADAGSGDVRA